MLVAGLDYSGDPKTGTKFLGIVVGTQDAVSSTLKSLGPGTTHMSQASKKRRREILSKLQFNNNVIVAFCIQSDTDNIVKEVRKRKPESRLPTRRIIHVHDQGLYRYFYDTAAAFFVRHSHDVREIIFQRDSDCASFTKANGLLSNVEDGDAYKLADIVAWSNTNRREPEGVVVGDIRDILRRKVLKRFG